MLPNGVKLLADGVYKSLGGPQMNSQFGRYIQCFLRLTVEHINRETKSFAFADEKVRCEPEMQVLGLIAVYKIIALKLEMFPRYEFGQQVLRIEAKLGITREAISKWAEQYFENQNDNKN